MIEPSKMMPSRHNEIRQIMIALKSADRITRGSRLLAARAHGRSGCNRLFTLRGHYDNGSFVITAKARMAERHSH